MFEIRPFPEWSWSKSRAQLLEECPRKYYYHYYGGHNGWLKEASKEVQLIYRLKQLTNLYLAFGNIVHSEIKNSIIAWKEYQITPDQQKMIDEVRHKLNQICYESTLKDKWWNYPSRFTMLHERYYGNQLPEYRVTQIRKNIYQCVENFFKSRTVIDLLNNNIGRVVEIDEELNHFFMDSQKIYVKLDMLSDNNNNWCVVDWKTGQEDKYDKDQMLIYALYIQEKYGSPSTNIEIRTEYLSSGECRVDRVNPVDLASIIETIRVSQMNMKRLLREEELNAPLPIQKFSPTPSKKVCGWCNFSQVCNEKYIN